MVAPKVVPQRREYIADPQLARVDQAREDLGRIVAMCPFLRGRLVSVKFTANVRKNVRHGLGVAAACMIIRHDYTNPPAGYGGLVEYTDPALDATQYTPMSSGVTITVDLWFYARASKDIDAGQGQSL